MLIKIDNRDLPYTIDSYGMFNGDGAHESELEYLATEYPELEKDYPKLEVGFNWSHPDIVKDLAGSSLAIIEHEMHREKWLISAPIIKETRSPQFYNYTTDWYVAEWDIDRDELDKAVPEGWQEQAKERGWTEDDFADEESVVVMKLSATMLEILSEDDYNSQMWEKEDEAYYENMSPDEETQKAIDEIEARREKKQ